MKEKRVDIYLALAGLFQLLLIAVLGYLATELIKQNFYDPVTYWTSFVSIALIAAVFYCYKYAFNLIRKSKRKRS